MRSAAGRADVGGEQERPEPHGGPGERIGAALLPVDDADRVRDPHAGPRSASTASSAAPPEVTTSSTRQTHSPASKAPSIRFPVP